MRNENMSRIEFPLENLILEEKVPNNKIIFLKININF